MDNCDDNEAAFTSAPAVTGLKLKVLRTARFLGVIWLYHQYQFLRRGYAITHWIDPFETTRLVWALSNRIAHDDRIRIELGIAEFEEWISPNTKNLPGFSLKRCFDKLLRELPAEPLGRNNYLRGRPWVLFVPSSDRGNRKVVIHVVCRGDRPLLTPGQHYRLMKKLRKMESINIQTVEQLHIDALRRNWRIPSIPRPPRKAMPLIDSQINP